MQKSTTDKFHIRPLATQAIPIHLPLKGATISAMICYEPNGVTLGLRELHEAARARDPVRRGRPLGRSLRAYRKIKMAKQDLRTWIAEMEAADQLQRVSAAEPEEEIGGIVDVYQRKIGNKAVLFDSIPGFPSGYRILANILTSIPRINLTIGIPASSKEIDLVQFWRRYMREMRSISPVIVAKGLLQENVRRCAPGASGRLEPVRSA
jgi:hypothetical protein